MYGPRGSIVSNDIPWVQQMRPAPETLTMDREILAKKNRITVSNNVAIFLLLAFFGCIVATALLVFYLAPCPEGTTSTTHLVPQTGDAHGHTESPDLTTAATEEPPYFTTVPPATSGRNVRLPRSVRPVEYDLWIQPFIEEGNFTFQGRVEITLNVTEATGNITLHANELEIEESSVMVLGPDGAGINSLSYEIDKELQFFIIELGREIEPGNYSIKMNYTGILNDVLQGFYRSSYLQNNSTRWIVGTQFQPTDARRAFPCFDEPAFKAKFTIHITGDEKLQPISNMPLAHVSSNSVNQSPTWYNFQQSVPMSTYLVAFVVQDFVHMGTDTFSVYVRRDAGDQVAFSIDIGPKLLKFYETYFGIPFPLPKIFMVAMPDFSAGAMENWGLITFRESALLYEEGVSSRINKQRIATVIAHELAHQWFGNLVTPTWWTDLWLNEGFASYLEYIGTDAINPSWKVLDQFVVNELQSVFSLDALKSSHQISIEVNNPDEINYIFDKISYSKGATIIRMMEQFLTEEVFRKGLTNYLNANKFGNAQQDDLWKALTDQAHTDNTLDSDMTVKEIMDTWTLQVGFPVINATRNYEDGTLQLSQSRFFLNANVNETKPSLWWVPISYTSLNQKVGKVWLRGVPEITINTSIPINNWLLVNVNQTGYFRVNYDLKNWELITNQLRGRSGHRGHLAFDSKNRAQILDDAFNLANAGLLNYTRALSITSYLKEERDLVPWRAAFVGLDYLYEMFLRRGNFDILKEYMLSLIIPLYREVGFRDNASDSLLVTRTRFEVLLRACRLGYSDCIKNAAMQFQNWLSTSHPDKHNPISPNIKGVVYCTAIRVGGETEWNFAWERYRNTNVGTEKELLLSALACTREAWLLNRYLDLAVTEGSGIRRQDAPTVFAAISRNIVGQPLAFRFLTSQWEKIKLYLGTSFISVNSMIRSVTLNFNTEEEMDDLKNFAVKKTKDLGVTSNTINQALEQIEANIQWMSRNYKVILDWLEKYNKKKSRR